jgi:pyruvate dehydrogenase E2 component (dihydrolipoamide acetyltransferase)
MTMPDFLLPDLGEGLEEAEVLAWRVQVGDRVAVDQVIVEVETAKAAVEVPVPFAGIVAQLHAAPGTVVSVGQPLITIAAGEPAAGFREPGVVTGAAAAAPGPESPADAGGSGSVLVGYGTTVAPRRARRTPRRAASPAAARAAAPDQSPGTAPAAPAEPVPETSPAPQAAAARGTLPETSPGSGAERAAGRTGPVPVISPLVRKLARDAGLDLTVIAGTGPAGLVRRADVHAALARRDNAAPPAGAGPGLDTNGTGANGMSTTGGGAGGTRIPLRGARRAMADKLTRSRREIPEATVWVDVDATGLLAARRELNAAAPEQPVSLLALLARFTLLALRRYPELNGRIGPDEITIPGHVHLGFAAQTERGLVVPVVRDAHQLTTRELSAALAARTAAARDGTLAPSDLTGGTFTVNNYGVFGVDGSAAIINYPEVAILGLGRVIDRPWVVGGQVVVRSVTELTLAFDHRACDGGTAGGFLRYIADCIESPVAALGDL